MTIKLVSTVTAAILLGAIAGSLDVVRVTSASMEPGLHDGDNVLVLRRRSILGYAVASASGLSHGQVIIFNAPISIRRSLAIKRIVGLPGEQVHLNLGRLIVNRHTVPEPYARNEGPETWPRTDTGLPNFTVPARHYFLLGDNRISSMDSRVWGAVAEDDVVAAVICTVPSILLNSGRA